MTIKKQSFILISVIIIFGFMAFLSPSTFLGKRPSMEVTEAADGIVSASPAIITLNQPSNVTVTIQITDSRLISGSVNLQRLDASGTVIATLGTLNDAGTNGDVVAGDKIFTVKNTFNEATATPVQLRVSWALKGVLKRAMSNTVTVEVWKKITDQQSTIEFNYPPQYVVNTIQDNQGNNFEMWEKQQNLTEGLPPSFSIITQNVNLQGETLEAFVTRTLGEPIEIRGLALGFLEVFEPSEGEGLFHHFKYRSDKNLLVDVIARTTAHDNDSDFIKILKSLSF
jgi:hypothetical protein